MYPVECCGSIMEEGLRLETDEMQEVGCIGYFFTNNACDVCKCHKLVLCLHTSDMKFANIEQLHMSGNIDSNHAGIKQTQHS